MATYYIDYDTGDDGNNGTTTGTPWKHHPWDANATGTADSTTLVGDDITIFKGGVSYKGTITMAASGTSGHPIVLDGNTAGTWGTGDAIIDGDGTRLYGIATFAAISYVTIRGLRITNTDSSDTNAHGIFYYPSTTASGLVIDDCEIDTIGGDAIQVAGIASAVTISNCTLHDGNVDGIKGPFAGSSTISGNTIYGFDSVTNHGDAMQVYPYDASSTLSITNNVCYGCTQHIYINSWTNSAHGAVVIYGNRVYRSGATDYNAIVIDTETAGDTFTTISVYHNTTVDADSGSGGIRVVDRGGGVTTLNVKNNLFYNSVENIAVAKVGTLNRDYNAWSSSAEAAEETHGQALTGDPFVNAAARNYHLSAATTAGETLGSPYDTDPDSETRGDDGTVDRGAYEYVAGGVGAYHVIYSANGALSGTVPTETDKAENDPVTVADNSGSLARESYYAFVGWNTAADGSGTDYAPGATMTMPAADVTLYAVWRVKCALIAG